LYKAGRLMEVKNINQGIEKYHTTKYLNVCRTSGPTRYGRQMKMSTSGPTLMRGSITKTGGIGNLHHVEAYNSHKNVFEDWRAKEKKRRGAALR